MKMLNPTPPPVYIIPSNQPHTRSGPDSRGPRICVAQIGRSCSLDQGFVTFTDGSAYSYDPSSKTEFEDLCASVQRGRQFNFQVRRSRGGYIRGFTPPADYEVIYNFPPYAGTPPTPCGVPHWSGWFNAGGGNASCITSSGDGFIDWVTSSTSPNPGNEFVDWADQLINPSGVDVALSIDMTASAAHFSFFQVTVEISANNPLATYLATDTKSTPPDFSGAMLHVGYTVPAGDSVYVRVRCTTTGHAGNCSGSCVITGWT